MNRPVFISLVLATLLGSYSGLAGEKNNSPLSEGIYATAFFKHKTRTIDLQTESDETLHIIKSEAITHTKASICSADNKNSTYILTIIAPPKPEAEGLPVLVINNKAIAADNAVHSRTGYTATYTLDKKTAKKAAKLFKIKLKNRQRLDQGIDHLFNMTTTVFKTGHPIAVEIELFNNSADSLMIDIGGAYQGSGRNNRFSFEVFYEGKKLPDIGTSIHTGGLAARPLLESGDRHISEAELTKWATFDQPGVYTVECTWHTIIRTPDSDSDLDYAHEKWDKKFTGTMMITIQDHPESAQQATLE